MTRGSLRRWVCSNWSWVFAALVAAGLISLVLVYWEWLSCGESGSTTLRNLGLMVAGVIALWFAYRRSWVADRQAETSHRGLLNERYQKGAEMLGSDVLTVRLGGIYALQRLAEENAEQYHIQIMRLLCAFVRHPTGDKDRDKNNNETGDEGQPDNKDDPVREDVQAAMKVIGTRSSVGIELEQEEDFYLDLVGAHLVGAHLPGAHLTRTDLSGAHLTRADLSGAHLSDAFLTGADLTGACLNGASLNGADLTRTDLAGAFLTDTHLAGAFLTGAHLTGAFLVGAHLTGAHLIRAHLIRAHLNGADLTRADLTRADLSGADLSRTDLTGTRLDGADLTGVDLAGADLTGANLTSSTLSKAKGLTQQQLDRAVAMSAFPPELGGLRDAKTGDLLEWHGGEPKFPSLGAAPGR